MRFALAQQFGHDPDLVQRTLIDAGFLEQMPDLGALARPVLESERRDGALVCQRIRHRFRGETNAAMRRVVDPDRLTWIEVREIDTAARWTDFRIEPEHYQSLLQASGSARIEGVAGGARRVVEGEVRVRIPIVGRKVEQAIVSGLEEYASAEQAAVDAWLGA